MWCSGQLPFFAPLSKGDVNQPLLVEEDMDLVMQSVEGPEQAKQEAHSGAPSSAPPASVPRADTSDCSLGKAEPSCVSCWLVFSSLHLGCLLLCVRGRLSC